MKKTGLKLITLAAVAIPLALVVLTACEKEKSASDDVDAYFAAHPYLSDPRDERTDITIIPGSATIKTVGEQVMFQASNGAKPLSWDVVDANNGTISEQPDERYALYTALTLGPNTVVVSDRRGMAALAEINGSASGLSILPSSATLLGNGEQVTLTASGGTPPYTWRIVYQLLGEFVPSGLDEVSGASVTYQRDAEGDNIVVVTDHHGDTATISITQTAPPPPQISPSSVTITAPEYSQLFEVSGGRAPFQWNIISMPGGGGATLSTATGTTTVFTRTGAEGTYILQVQDANLATDAVNIFTHD